MRLFRHLPILLAVFLFTAGDLVHPLLHRSASKTLLHAAASLDAAKAAPGAAFTHDDCPVCSGLFSAAECPAGAPLPQLSGAEFSSVPKLAAGVPAVSFARSRAPPLA